jgi:serine/threonine-protein kinase
VVDRIGAYEIQEELGRGGMAVVYKAYQPALDRTVALKLMLAGLEQGPTYLARFQREARAAGRMQHPNIVTIYDYGEQDGKPFLVMEYITGGTLADRLRAGALDPGQAMWVGGQIADALDYAHRQGFVHRDVKPANILLTGDGRRAVLSDFGIARLLEQEQGAGLTAIGLTLGTPDYMSPEQAMAEPLDGRSDLYSLGVVLYHTLTGRLPFAATNPNALVAAMLTKDPVPPRQVNPHLSAQSEAVLLKALARDREYRFQSGGEFKRALESAQAVGPAAPTAYAPRPGVPPVVPAYVPSSSPATGPPAGSPAPSSAGAIPLYGGPTPADSPGFRPPPTPAAGMPVYGGAPPSAAGAPAYPPPSPAGGVPAYPPPSAPYSVPPLPPRPPRSRSPLPWILGGLGAAALVGIALCLALAVAVARSGERTTTPTTGSPGPATPRPATPSASTTAGAAGTVLISERFADNKNNWPADNINTALDPGRYRIKSVSATENYRAGPGKSAADVAVEAEVQRLAGPANGQFGIYARNTNNVGFYIFSIGEDGRYSLRRWVESLRGYDEMASGTTAVNRGARNTLKLVAKGRNFRMEVNGKEVGRAEELKQFSTFGTYGVWVSVNLEMAVTRFEAVVP